MNKLQRFKEAMKNPPPDRLAKIEYQSHFLQIIGVIIVCSILIYKGFWYIIFALIFSVGVSYSQGITAYHKYKIIKHYKPLEEWEKDFEKDISPTRKRDNIITHVFGKFVYWGSIIVSVIVSYGIYLDVGIDNWFMKILMVFICIIIHIIIYYILIYPFALNIYKEEKNKNGLDKNSNSKTN